MDEPLMTFKSHIEGRNADVAIYPDRVEWSRSKRTLGELMGLGHQDTNMILIRSIQGVTTHKAGMAYTAVKLSAGSAGVEFRVTKAQAAQVKDTITRLMLAAGGG